MYPAHYGLLASLAIILLLLKNYNKSNNNGNGVDD